MIKIIRLKSLDIHQFRNFHKELKLNINPNLTLIVGQNATSKSTLLGMLCQPFEFTAEYKVYTNVYDNIKKSEVKTILGKTFESQFSDVFRMSPIYDNPKDKKYFYDIELELDDKILKLPVQTKSRPTTNNNDNNIRFVVGKTRHRGEGNFPHPVIYLGLNRLYPLANSKKIELDTSYKLTKDEISFYSTWQKNITVLQENVSPEYVSTDIKDFLGCKTSFYDAETNSAGQDNIGQIISAILSFKRLKEQLKDNYQGGMLLIDEVDATLHQLAKIKLLEFLIEMSDIYSLQIICTTHSTKMIELCSQKYKNKSSIIALYKRGNNIYANSNVSFDDICAELSANTIERKIYLTTTIFEDSTAAQFFKAITFNMYNDFLKINNDVKKNDETALPSDVCLRLASKKIPEFEKILFIIDGDKANQITKKHHNIIALPGNKALEIEMYYFLKSLPTDDEFWSKDIGKYNYQMCFKDYNSLEIQSNNIQAFKNWFISQKKEWGRSNNKLYKRWIKANKNIVLDFNEKFFKLHNKIAKIKSTDEILTTIKNKINAL
ncbi:AAA family ATPase [uncultured Megamonas sp.]|uniref:AAA family ATPase n=1 Tax=uncultured Megamonas sp. TaxID=286140 RepID=UPI002596F35C|nr:AAA family ATPase [uncultured Megamonas sp.]